MITLLLIAFLPFLSTSYLNFTFFFVIGCPCVHISTEVSVFFLLEFKLFLNNIHVLVGLMGRTSVDVNQTEITMTMQSIFLVNLHL